MPSSNFDERYPAMFQPGGETTGMIVEDPTAYHSERAQTLHVMPEPIMPEHVPPLHEGHEPTRGGNAEAAPWPFLTWLGPLLVAFVLLAGGVFSLSAQYWLPSATTFDPSKFQGVDLQPWGYAVVTAAAPLFMAGCGILGALVFLASRRDADREASFRRGFGVLAAAIGVAGWVGMFAPSMFPQALSNFGDNSGGYAAMPWTYLVGGSGLWLFILALSMTAVLTVLPPGQGRPRPLRGLGLGAVLSMAGTYALLAPYLHPTATGTVIVELANGAQATSQGWAALAPTLAAPLLLVGLAVIGWAVLYLAATARRGPAAEGGPSAVEPENEES
ncbi:hypothetical protein JOF48_001970 [Arthrobacter stackebrandtii]|uniref:Uncharacterized protein n=1 Tax=Arthrobacter stackebrandtii TaxID=272161 RepID=A0ABS4YWH8_9MICC|nr:hypothetical protein [Arthrobacter stackebrandtii]MBP2413171.1 hypothetical protein [Arthrobacter stackebrandtii]PYH01071.1 hypothetical protein CVV67_05580 [Arthrobacter stackebrandtii]